MAISPQILESIRNPTGGKLGDIAQTYLKSKQVGIENARNADKDKMIADKFKFEKMDRESKIVQGLSKDAIQWYESQDASPTDEEFKIFQDNQFSKVPDNIKPLARMEFQSIDTYREAFDRSSNIQKYLNPSDYKDELFSTPDAYRFTPESRKSYEKSGKQSDLILNKEAKKQMGVGAMSGWVRDSDGDRVTSGFMANTGDVFALENGDYRKLASGEEFVQGKVQDVSEDFGGGKGDKLELFKEDLPVLKLSDERAEIARRALPRINLSIDMYRKGLIKGGALTEFTADFRNYFKSITGFDMSGADDINSVYTATATAKDVQLTKTKDLKGAISERELALSGQATGMGINNPAEASLLNLKIIKMANLREEKYNTEMRSYIEEQRSRGKKPSLDTFSGEFAKETKAIPGIVSNVQKVNGRDNVQYLFYWEQKEKELNEARMSLIKQGATPEQQDAALIGIGNKFDKLWSSKYGTR